MRTLFMLGAVALLAACTDTGGGTPTQQPAPKVQFVRSTSDGLSAYRRVSARMEPVAEQICRGIFVS